MIQGFSTLNKDFGENLAWLTQNTSNSNTVNVIELFKNKKVATPPPPFQGYPPFLAKILEPSK